VLLLFSSPAQPTFVSEIRAAPAQPNFVAKIRAAATAAPAQPSFFAEICAAPAQALRRPRIPCNDRHRRRALPS
jgi:hypothetical protein